MGRKSIFRRLILDALRGSNNSREPRDPLTFGGIKEEIAQTLKRDAKKVYDGNIGYNLKELIREGLVSKTIFNNEIAYKLTNHYYNQQTKMMIAGLLESTNEKFLYSGLEENSPPFVALTDIQDLEETDETPQMMKRTKYFIPYLHDWSDTSYPIAARMLETYQNLSVTERKGIAKLLAHAYWAGVRSSIKEFYEEGIRDCKDFALKCIENAKTRNDQQRIEAEKAIISLLDICVELISKDNLRGFLEFAMTERFEVKKLQSVVVDKMGQFMAAGEKIFDSLVDFHHNMTSALVEARVLQIDNSSRFLTSYSAVWNHFIDVVFRDFLSDEELEEINEGSSDALEMVKKYHFYMKTLREIPTNSKIQIIYLWGYPEIFDTSDKAFLPWFEGWKKALETGNIDHRSFLFAEGLERLESAIRTVKSGKRPPKVRICYESWTLSDLYDFHPRGKDPEFYQELLSLVRARKPEHLKLYRRVD